VREAVALSDRIYVLTPGRHGSLPNSRCRTRPRLGATLSPEASRLEAALLDTLLNQTGD
jgi:ABC-type nitrate/sulfonate/bicarbonate transport system ATPase subunit